ncbi:RNA polymerase Rpb1, domain 1 [Pelomyxa schiedti]|nr:RNA polymerase Rpb1, domain 1 [Pelomyxa schiedti]
MALLDGEFFELVDSRTVEGFVYQAYRPLYPRSTIVLFSEVQGQPVAAFTVIPRNCNSVLTKRTCPPPVAIPPYCGSASYFQELLSANNREFDFVISNLTHFEGPQPGFINFNVLHTAHQVREVDPGPAWGVNQVNELKPSESYRIECDQRTNRSMKLVGVTKSTSTGTSEAVTVQEDEQRSKQTGEATQGTYFYLSVVGTSAIPEMATLFQSTDWKCVEVFVRKIPVAPPATTPHTRPRARQPTGDSDRDSTLYRSEMEECKARRQRGERSRSRSNSPETLHKEKRYQKKSKAVSQSRRGRGGRGGGVSSRESTTTSTSSAERSFSIPDDVVNSAQAGNVVSGSRIIAVNSVETGQQYNFDTPGELCILGLSIWTGMHLEPLLTNVQLSGIVESLLNEYTTNANASILATLKKQFPSEECVICLGPTPDTVFIQCGHQCCHMACISGGAPTVLCPLCRGRIIAKVLSSTL